MSDYPNGTPPGQNNLHAGTEPYVKSENDPSATAQKPDADREKTDGIEVKEDTKPEVQQELDQAAKEMVQPASVEENQEQEEQQEEEQKPQPKSPPPPPAPKQQDEPVRSTTKK